MNTLGLIVLFLAVATTSAATYKWETKATIAPGPTRSQLGNLFLHVNQGGVTGMIGMTKKIPLNEFATPGFDMPWSLGPYHTFSSDIKTNIPVSNVKGVSFEWTKSSQDKEQTQELSLSKVVITPTDDKIPYEKRSRYAVSFCYDGPNVQPGTIVKMKSCSSLFDSIFG